MLSPPCLQILTLHSVIFTFLSHTTLLSTNSSTDPNLQQNTDMRSNRRRAAGLILLSSVGVSNAVILGDFLPRITNLPNGCNEVYLRDIPGCNEEQFARRSCSEACVAGLQQIQGDLQSQCGSARGIPEDTIVATFLAGRGIQAVCRNVAVVTDRPREGPPAPTSNPPRPPPPSPSPSSDPPTFTLDPSRPAESSETRGPPAPSSDPPRPNPPPTDNDNDEVTSTGGADPAAVTQTGSAPDQSSVSGGGSVFDELSPGGSSSATVLQIDFVVRVGLLLVTPCVLLASALL